MESGFISSATSLDSVALNEHLQNTQYMPTVTLVTGGND